MAKDFPSEGLGNDGFYWPDVDRFFVPAPTRIASRIFLAGTVDERPAPGPELEGFFFFNRSEPVYGQLQRCSRIEPSPVWIWESVASAIPM